MDHRLIFLDIEMDDTNGFDAAEELMSGSSQPLIVFVTKSTEYTIRGYDVAFHYLVKPLNEEKFYEVLKRALRLIVPQYFSFSSNGELYRIPVQEILYFESRNYMLFIHTQQQIYKTRLSLKEVEPQLSSANFLRIHASFLINLHHVVRITKDDIEMQDHQLIKISRNRKKDVIAAFTKFARENI
jgi:DNA-binding LytR/AlgR family response regulator